MAEPLLSTVDHVGPVLAACPVTDAVIEAIKDLNANVVVVDSGAYMRVLAPDQCLVTVSAIEAHLGRSFALPQDLEKIMSSFKGNLTISGSHAMWRKWKTADSKS